MIYLRTPDYTNRRSRRWQLKATAERCHFVRFLRLLSKRRSIFTLPFLQWMRASSGPKCAAYLVAVHVAIAVGSVECVARTVDLSPAEETPYSPPHLRRPTLIAQNPASSQADGPVCRTDGTPRYSPAAYNKLMAILAYDRGPGRMGLDEMQLKLQRLITEFPYPEIKALLIECAPQFKQKYFDPPRSGTLDAQLKRSRVIIYDEIDKQQFSRVLVLLTGVP